MTYVVGEPCVNCKYGDCVDACPVDCFYQDDRMLYINPAECIDCDACKPECPVEAIFPASEEPPYDQTGCTHVAAYYVWLGESFDYSEHRRVISKEEVHNGSDWDESIAIK